MNVTVYCGGLSDAFTETLEIKAGSDTTVAAMNLEVMKRTDFRGSSPQVLSGFIRPKTDGVYHLGFHALSAANNYTLNISKYEIAEPINGSAPVDVEDLTVSRDVMGAREATLSFTVPSKNIQGEAITGTVEMKIQRNGADLTTLTGLQPGSKQTYVDRLKDTDADGVYTYCVTGVINGAEGIPAEGSTYVGPCAPAEFTTASLVEISEGTVKADWAAITTDSYGDVIPEADAVKYHVYSAVIQDESLAIGQELTPAAGIIATTFTTTVSQEKQDAFYLILQAEFKGKKNSARQQ